MLSQLRESDLPVGDANRTLRSSSGLLELLPIYRPRSTIMGVKELVNTFPSSVCQRWPYGGNCMAAASIVSGNVWERFHVCWKQRFIGYIYMFCQSYAGTLTTIR